MWRRECVHGSDIHSKFREMLNYVRWNFLLWFTHRDHGCKCLRCHYRPQRSWAKVMFLQVSVILLKGGVSASVHAGMPTPHWDQIPLPQSRHPTSRHPPGADTPPEQTLPIQQTAPEQTPPPSRHPLEADSGIRSTSGRYASYWNAFLYSEGICPCLWYWKIFLQSSFGFWDVGQMTKLVFDQHVWLL